MAKKKLTTLKKKADKLWSQIIRQKGRCEVCGDTGHLNSHHIESRRNIALRHDIRNGCCLCSGCHTFRKDSAHQSPLFFDEWLRKNRLDDYNYIKDNRNNIKKMYAADYEQPLACDGLVAFIKLLQQGFCQFDERLDRHGYGCNIYGQGVRAGNGNIRSAPDIVKALEQASCPVV